VGVIKHSIFPAASRDFFFFFFTMFLNADIGYAKWTGQPAPCRSSRISMRAVRGTVRGYNYSFSGPQDGPLGNVLGGTPPGCRHL